MTTTTQLFPPAAIVPPKPRHPYYLVNGMEMVRVTHVLDATLPKPALVPWARRVALEKARAELYNYVDDPLFGGQRPIERRDVDWIIELAARRPDEVKDAAAGYGTRVHALLQAHLLGKELEVPGELRGAFTAAFEWLQRKPGRVAAVEQTVWSDDCRYAGTVDLIWENPDGSLDVGDWKTSAGIYPEMAAQLGAYAGPVEALTGRRVRDCWVMRLPKEKPENGKPLFEAARLSDWGQSYVDFQELLLRWHRSKRKVFA